MERARERDGLSVRHDGSPENVEISTLGAAPNPGRDEMHDDILGTLLLSNAYLESQGSLSREPALSPLKAVD